jgi:DHA2 family lincomycin resistance protein-like MFS transporter
MATGVLMLPEDPRRTPALSVGAAVASCGLVLGFVRFRILTVHTGWRWIFLGSVPFILVVLLAVVFLVEGDRAPGQGRPAAGPSRRAATDRLPAAVHLPPATEVVSVVSSV